MGGHILVPYASHQPELLVSDLIDHDIGRWNSALVHMLFDEDDSARILATPLLRQPMPDSYY